MLTLEECANSLGLAPITLRVQIRNGRLIAVKRAGVWFVEESECERYRREHLGQKRNRWTRDR